MAVELKQRSRMRNTRRLKPLASAIFFIRLRCELCCLANVEIL